MKKLLSLLLCTLLLFVFGCSTPAVEVSSTPSASESFAPTPEPTSEPTPEPTPRPTMPVIPGSNVYNITVPLETYFDFEQATPGEFLASPGDGYTFTAKGLYFSLEADYTITTNKDFAIGSATITVNNTLGLSQTEFQEAAFTLFCNYTAMPSENSDSSDNATSWVHSAVQSSDDSQSNRIGGILFTVTNNSSFCTLSMRHPNYDKYLSNIYENPIEIVESAPASAVINPTPMPTPAPAMPVIAGSNAYDITLGFEENLGKATRIEFLDSPGNGYIFSAAGSFGGLLESDYTITTDKNFAVGSATFTVENTLGLSQDDFQDAIATVFGYCATMPRENSDSISEARDWVETATKSSLSSASNQIGGVQFVIRHESSRCTLCIQHPNYDTYLSKLHE